MDGAEKDVSFIILSESENSYIATCTTEDNSKQVSSPRCNNMLYAICFTNLHAPDLAPPLRTCCRYFPSLLTSAGTPNFLASQNEFEANL